MYYPTELVEEIRFQNTIEDVIGEYIQLKKRGSSYFGLCPFHNENTASFSVSPDKQMYYCFGCGAGGNVYTFIMQMENYNFVESIQYLAERARITLPEPEMSEQEKERIQIHQQLLEIHKEAARYFYSNLHSNRGQYALKYLTNRKIEPRSQKTFGLGYANVARSDLYQFLASKGYDDQVLLKSGLIIPEKRQAGYFDRFFNRLIFPIFDVHNRVIGFGGRVLGEGQPKYLNSPETLLFDKSKNLYGLNIARTSREDQILIVEGYLDVIALHQAGISNVVASLGTAFTVYHAQLLRRYVREVVLIYDSDEAGIRAALRAIPILEQQGLRVKILEIPGQQDPDDYIIKYGKEAFRELLEKETSSSMEFEIKLMMNKYNLDDPEGKIAFMEEAGQRLIKISNTVEQEIYTQEVAKIGGIPLEVLKKEMIRYQKTQKVISPTSPVSTSPKRTEKDTGIVKAQRNLLCLLLTESGLYEQLKKYLSPQDFIDGLYRKVAELIYQGYENGEKMDGASIIGKFELLEEQQKVSKIFTTNLVFQSKEERQKIIHEQVRLVKQSSIEHRSRTTTDLAQLQGLITEKRQLEQMNISWLDG
ncbi:MAG: DNA primase [Epulopiscium sp.]|nr:DNA primase [Candidatus Epulonipiscium sp.]